MSYALVFPGQGAQSIGMLQPLAEMSAIIADTYAEASEALGYDLWAVVCDGPESKLNSTEYTQPAILVGSVAVYRMLRSGQFEIEGFSGEAPVAVAGHSLGEYSALCAAGTVQLGAAARLVAERGRLMQAAVAGMDTAMAAVLGLEDQDVINVCEHLSQTMGQKELVAAVNFNCPGQVVIAGTKKAVARASEQLKGEGAKRIVPVPVSVPSHCILMKSAAEELAEAIETAVVSAPAVPVIQNLDGEVAQDLKTVKDKLVRQLYTPVQWVSSMQTLLRYQPTVVLECGPGAVLSGLLKKIDRSVSVKALSRASEWRAAGEAAANEVAG
ncbi:ACP S-malonyltransferase [Allohahella sp. A8]|uniref:ACP S-malonyltransferase n=1 Tax=Allohahella sp. A8 TaxID=3141461 RepID=UPI000C0AB6AD|nr:[acyl-carrier-protein] S-malonyltransferase [Hahellaceae bacterium]|tara:strand:- start:4465 stop:5445 length:981 start_codon:yes stop_codon:yes gene_type:complete